MILTDRAPTQNAPPDLTFPYLMTGVALGCIWFSYLMGAIFAPGFVTGVQHDHFNSAAAIGWIFNAIATGLVVSAALAGIHAKVTDKAPWTMLGLGAGAIWIAVMFVAIFAPVWVTGTDPDQIPFWSGFAAIVGVILTWMLGRFVKAASFEPAEVKVGSTTPMPPVDVQPAADDATVTLRRLAQLRDSGAITEAEFEAKKKDLLSRI